MRRTLREAAVIVASGAVLGLALNAVHARGLQLWRPVYAAAETGTGSCVAVPGTMAAIAPVEAASLCLDCTAAFVDARTASAYAQGHVAGAMHLPPIGHSDEPALLRELRQKRTVVAYDDGGACKLAWGVAQRLKANGVGDVRVLVGGWAAWLDKGEPSASGACEQCALHGARP